MNLRRWKSKKEVDWILAAQSEGTRVMRRFMILSEFRGNRRQYPFLVYITFEYERRPMPSPTEMDRFEQVDALLQSLESELSFVNVAIVTGFGKRDWVCYASTGSEFVSAIYERVGEYSPWIESQLDPKWSQHKDLLGMLAKG